MFALLLPILNRATPRHINAIHVNIIAAVEYKKIRMILMCPGYLSDMYAMITPPKTLNIVEEKPIQPQSV